MLKFNGAQTHEPTFDGCLWRPECCRDRKIQVPFQTAEGWCQGRAGSLSIGAYQRVNANDTMACADQPCLERCTVGYENMDFSLASHGVEATQ
jgi:hypothetical protein